MPAEKKTKKTKIFQQELDMVSPPVSICCLCDTI